MTATVANKEIPPLAELAQASLREVEGYIPSLSLPEILIIGARPLDRVARPDTEVKELSQVVQNRIEYLEANRERVLDDILRGLYTGIEVRQQKVQNYLEKYEALVDPSFLIPQLEVMISNGLLKEVRGYRTSINVYRDPNSKKSPNNVKELASLERTPVNLVFYFVAVGWDLYFISAKTKAYERMASKIPYYLIKDHRGRGGEGGRKSFAKNLVLERGVTRDNVGLQFVTLSAEELAKIKEHITTSPNIEVLGLDDYYAQRKGPYHAIHIDAVWNPQHKPQLLNPHTDRIEIILMELPYFISSNLGPESYWRRINAQKQGIVDKNLRSGVLQIDRFTPAELQWKGMVEQRIMAILTYDNQKYAK